MDNLKVIIPCAGYGTRVGMKPDESKELLVSPYERKPIIQHSLDICKDIGATPVVISRKEKKDLNTYLQDRGITPLIINPEGEWMNTIYKSRVLWAEYNILMLPDTRWAPTYTSLYNLTFSIRDLNAPLAFALHKVEDKTKWCVRSDDGFWMMEKPVAGGTNWAFGLVAWQAIPGEQFFYELSNTEELYETRCAATSSATRFTYLQNFEDITRGDIKLKRR